jgi:hypothetical protein
MHIVAAELRGDDGNAGRRECLHRFTTWRGIGQRPGKAIE